MAHKKYYIHSSSFTPYFWPINLFRHGVTKTLAFKKCDDIMLQFMIKITQVLIKIEPCIMCSFPGLFGTKLEPKTSIFWPKIVCGSKYAPERKQTIPNSFLAIWGRESILPAYCHILVQIWALYTCIGNIWKPMILRDQCYVKLCLVDLCTLIIQRDNKRLVKMSFLKIHFFTIFVEIGNYWPFCFLLGAR